MLFQLAIVFDVKLLLSLFDLVERRLCNIEMTSLNQFWHLPEEEGKNQRSDVRSIHIGISHDDNSMITKLGCVEIFAADPGAERSDHRADFCIGKHLVETRFFHI